MNEKLRKIVTASTFAAITTLATMVNVYPNPAQGSFNVKLDKESDVNIYNAVGQLVKTYNNVMEWTELNKLLQRADCTAASGDF